jgi:prefoldin subunit 5
MADENKPSDKVDLASTELKIGGVNLKGSYIVWFLACVSAVGGTIYAAGGEWGKYQKLQEAVAQWKSPDMEPVVKMTEQINNIEGELDAINKSISELQTLGGKLTIDVTGMQKLIEANDVSKLQGAISQLRTTVDGVQVFTRDVQALREQMVAVQKDMASLKKDVDSQWNAIDSIGAGALKGK